MYIVASIESKLICFCLAQSWKPLVMQRLFTTTTQVDLGSSFTCSLTPRDEWMEEKFKTVSFYTHMCTALCWVKYTHCTYSLHNSIGHFLLITASYVIYRTPHIVKNQHVEKEQITCSLIYSSRNGSKHSPNIFLQLGYCIYFHLLIYSCYCIYSH